MLYTVQNDSLSVTANDHGAELSSLMFNDTEFLWCGDQKWWPGRAPILFPIVGNLCGDSYTHNSRKYTMGNHGFARRSVFGLADKTNSAITFSLRADDDTRAVYPFEFELLVTYAVDGGCLHTNFEVNNRSDKDMFFSIGGHPAFNCPLFPDEYFDDYEIVFNLLESAGNHIVDQDGFVSDETTPFFNNSDTLSLNYDLFQKHETLVFSGLNSSVATLRSRKTGAGIIMDFSDFPIFAIWTKPGAPFICMEPCQGINDAPEFTGDLCDKRGIVKLAPGADYNRGYSISPVYADN